MNDTRDFDRAVYRWLDEGSDVTPPEVIDAVLLAVRSTPQERRSWWPAWRTNRMNTYAKLIVAAAAVLVVAIGAYQLLPGRSGFGGTIATPWPSPALLARGTFNLLDSEVELNATGGGDSVTGTMTVSSDLGDFSVDLKCSRTTEDGVILIAGDITDSTSPYAREGAREVIVLKPGSPVYASFDSEGRAGGDVTPAASCPALLEQVIDTGTQTVIGPNGLGPIEGTVEFGP